MTIVRYRRYEDFDRQRIATNDTMMGLLAGSHLASETLANRPDSNMLLSEAFPSVPHIKRLNVTTHKAKDILNNAEGLLGVLAVPQVLGLQEDLLKSMLKLLKDNLPSVPRDILNNAKSATIHEKFEQAARIMFTPEPVQIYHLIRVARNTHIHNGGRADESLVNRRRDPQRTSTAALTLWEEITKNPFPDYQLGDPVHLGVSELIGILAVAKRLAEEANEALQQALPIETWAELAVKDWLKVRKPGNPEQQFKKLLGMAKIEYMALGLTERQLREAQTRLGVS